MEFAICRPERGDGAPVRVGRSKSVSGNQRGEGAGGGKRLEDCGSLWEKIWWVGELMVPSHRGIGWDWQIKDVPKDPDAELSHKRWVAHQGVKAALAYLGSLGMLVLLGYATMLEKIGSVSPFERFWMDAVIGWTGAIWIYLRLSSFYSFAAAVTVALGVYEMWQLPPLMGNVRDAWSVRQFWAVYHQTMRQVSCCIVRLGDTD